MSERPAGIAKSWSQHLGNPHPQSNSCTLRQNAAAKTSQVWNSGGGTLSYSTDNVARLFCTPTSSSSTGGHNRVTVNYATPGLAAGIYLWSLDTG